MKNFNRAYKTDRKRYFFSIIMAMLLVSSLVVASVGGILQGASARENYNRSNGYGNSSNSNQNRSSSNAAQNQPKPNSTNSNASKNTNTNTNKSTNSSSAPKPTNTNQSNTTTTQRTPTPAQPKQVAPAPATSPPPVAQAQSAPAPEVVQKVTPQITPPPIPTAEAVDTAPAIVAMTSAQADKETKAVTYTSGQLSQEGRNRILMLAGVAAVTGALLYTMSLFGAVPAATKREIPIRYIIPIKEGITS